MSKVIVAAALVVGAVVATVATGGAAAAAFVPALTGAFGVASQVAAIAIGAAGLWAVNTVSSALTPKPKSQADPGTQTNLKYDPLAGVPKVYGETAVGGFLSYMGAFGDKNEYLAVQSVLSGSGPIQGIETLYLGDDQFIAIHQSAAGSDDPVSGLKEVVGLNPQPGGTDGSALYVNHTQSAWSYGDPAAAESFSTHTGTALPGLDENSRMPGFAWAGVFLAYDQKAFPSGEPKLLWRIKGVKCYDPRKDSTQTAIGGSGSHRLHDYSTYEYSENPAVCALDHLLGRFAANGVKIAGCCIAAAAISMSAFAAWANVCDVNNWKVAGQVLSTDDKFAAFSSIAQAGSGKLAASGSQISVYYDAPKTSIYTVTADDVVGEASIINSPSYKDRHNQIVCSYREPSRKWSIIAGDLITVPEWITEDGGEARTIESTYSMVQQPTQAHQLAAYELVNNREFLSASVVCKPRLLGVRMGDCITVNLPEMDLNNQKMVVVGRTVDLASSLVTLNLTSETDGKHDYALGRTSVPPNTPELTSYDPSNPSAPVGSAWGITAERLINGDGVSVPAIVIQGGRDDPYAASIIAEYREWNSGSPGDWIAWGEAPPDTTGFGITGVVDGLEYQAAISYRTVRGVITPRLVMGPVTAGASVAASIINQGRLATQNTVDFVNDVINRPWWDSATGKVLANYVIMPDDGRTVAEVIAENAVIDTTPPGVPTGLSLSSSLTTNTDGSQLVTMSATWTALTDSDLNGYEIGVTPTGGTEVVWPVTSARYGQVVGANAGFSVRVRGVDKAGNRSAWTTASTITTAKDSTPPAAPTSITVDASAQSLFVHWTNPSDADIDHIEVLVGASSDGSDKAFIGTATAQPGVAGSYFKGGLTTGATRYFTLRAVDTSGNVSAYTTPVGGTPAQLSDADIAAIAAAKLTGQITTTQISDAGITTPKLATGSVTTAKIVTGAVTADTIGANAVIAGKVATGAITADNIVGNTITGDKINTATSLPGTITVGTTGVSIGTVQTTAASAYSYGATAYNLALDPATQVNSQSTTINGGKITTGSITTGQIAAYTITATNIAFGTLTGDRLAAGTITASNIAAGAIDATHVNGEIVTAYTIGAYDIAAGKIAAGNITVGLTVGNGYLNIDGGNARIVGYGP